ncbi:hypothetical protein LZ31DRAFT_477862 [Colletotrichum somersetense]|nr:hypothetical protein LZ31DRAFT_477862 [Colletotrichum somersetense]
MHPSARLAVLASLATGSVAAAVAGHQLLPRDKDCGTLTDVPLSSDPDHSSYSFILDPSVKDVIANATTSLGVTFNNIQVHQTCNKFDGFLTSNFGMVNVAGFGQDSPYTVQTDKCEKDESRSPLAYSILLCVGDGIGCAQSQPSLICGTAGVDGSSTRGFCAVTESGGGNPKAVNLTDPTAWSCQVCDRAHRFCSFSA